MREYIVGFTDDADMERFERLHGTNGELIRCKDCKHHYYHEMLKQDYCEIPNMQFGEIEPNGYCHRAERKEEWADRR